jgi:hypothetical protein
MQTVIFAGSSVFLQLRRRYIFDKKIQIQYMSFSCFVSEHAPLLKDLWAALGHLNGVYSMQAGWKFL